ncbi:MAG: 5'-nucleotidase SurE [Candidatus Sericytochromatia bacterium]|nr:MAG: 5'-nucleotidase SurE [Candidatus Sericytochromatia bacterium]
MNIVISNDDGIFAKGIKVLSETIGKEHDVYVLAPDRERSANGHALTLHKPLRAEEVNIFNNVKKSWQINGTPSDCIKLGVGAILNFKPDLIISGINRGQNMGTDVIYSGTVSAAMEGTILGIPSIAVSLASFEDNNYETAADFILNFIRTFNPKLLPVKTLLNINVPAVDKKLLKGYKITKLGIHRYIDIFEKRTDLRGKTYYWLAGESLEHEDDPDSDFSVVKNNYVSITPIHYDMTNYKFLNDLLEMNITI